MKQKSSAHYQREFRRRLREQGLVKKEVWIRPEHAKKLNQIEKALRQHLDETSQAHALEHVPSVSGRGAGAGLVASSSLGKSEAEKMDNALGSQAINWSTLDLFGALRAAPIGKSGAASFELIDGVEPSIHIVMHEFGDLPLFLTVSGEQILVEAILWQQSEVVDIAAFNEVVLRTHKYFPLSTISLDRLSDGRDYYHMFGALSASSLLSNISLEIEVLAANVLQATEAYQCYLSEANVEER